MDHLRRPLEIYRSSIGGVITEGIQRRFLLVGLLSPVTSVEGN